MLFDQKDSLPLRRVLRGHRYTSHGSYPLFFVMADDGCLCFSCAVENRAELVRALKDSSSASDVLQWRPYGVDVNYESEIECSHCHAGIESAYGVRTGQDNRTACELHGVTP
jgi:hypothetical protein